MSDKVKMKYSTCAVCGKRSRQPKLTEEQNYGWEVKYLDGMPDYRYRDKVVIPEVCPYCGFSYPSIEEHRIAEKENFNAGEYQNPLGERPEVIERCCLEKVAADVEACMRAAYLMMSAEVKCYRLALKQYVTAVWMFDEKIAGIAGEAAVMLNESASTGLSANWFGHEALEVCGRIRKICLEKAIYCCNILRKKQEGAEYSLLLLDLYRRRGLTELAQAYAEEMLEDHEWNSMDEKLMIRHQIALCKVNNMSPATLLMNGES